MTDLRSGPREPFGPRQPGVWGGVLRFVLWSLAQDRLTRKGR